MMILRPTGLPVYRRASKRLSRPQPTPARGGSGPCARLAEVAHTAARVPSCVAIAWPNLLSPKTPLWRSPPPACTALPTHLVLARCGQDSAKRPFIFLIRSRAPLCGLRMLLDIPCALLHTPRHGATPVVACGARWAPPRRLTPSAVGSAHQASCRPGETTQGDGGRGPGVWAPHS